MYRLVPIEPTEAMMDSMLSFSESSDYPVSLVREIYKLMIEAAPEQALSAGEAVYRCDYCGKDYTKARYCCQARREYLNRHGEYETRPAAGVSDEKIEILRDLIRVWRAMPEDENLFLCNQEYFQAQQNCANELEALLSRDEGNAT